MAFGEVTTNQYRALITQRQRATSGGAFGNLGNVIGSVLGGLVPTSLVPIPEANPPFALAAGAHPQVGWAGSRMDAHITRGYIRRDIDAADPTSRYRLNFMFNPETIQRDYIAYLDQGALDPYNTIFQSGNLVVPPGILDFSFELLFDRQIEVAQDATSRGTGVDYDYFDRVIRAVEPSTPASINTIPDTGVLMVNPRNITVVFSEQLTFQGKINNATISYDKFSHNMVPTRMTLGLSMKVFYVGPPAAPFDLGISQNIEVHKATVPYDQQITVTETNKSQTAEQIAAATTAQEILNLFPGLDLGSYAGNSAGGAVGANGGAAGPSGGSGGLPVPLPGGGTPTTGFREALVQAAESQIGKPYVWGGNGPSGFDCSGLVEWASRTAGHPIPGRMTSGQLASFATPTTQPQRGTLVFFAPGSVHHVAICTDNGLNMVDAPNFGLFVRNERIWSEAHFFGNLPW